MLPSYCIEWILRLAQPPSSTGLVVSVSFLGALLFGRLQEALDAHVEFLKGVVQGKPGWADADGTFRGGGNGSVVVCTLYFVENTYLVAVVSSRTKQSAVDLVFK